MHIQPGKHNQQKIKFNMEEIDIYQHGFAYFFNAKLLLLTKLYEISPDTMENA